MTAILERPTTTSTFDALRARSLGAVLEPGDAGYEAALAGFHLGFEQTPAAVLVARHAGDLVTGVRFARDRGLPVAVQNTGHSPVRAANGALLVNVAALRLLHVDADRRTLRAEAGVTWGEALAAAGRYGLTGLAGDTLSVGVAGFTLGGGMGWLGRRYGLGTDSVVEVEFVTADGRLRRVNAETDPELFWAIRGGGAGLGIVSAVTLRLFPVKRVLAGQAIFPGELATDVLRFYREWTAAAPDELTTTALLTRGPDMEALPSFVRGRAAIAVRFAYAGDPDEGRAVVAPLLALSGRIVEQVAEVAPVELGTFFGPAPAPAHGTGRAEHADALTDGLINALAEFVSLETPVLTLVDVRHLGGAVRRGPEIPNSYGDRDASYLMNMRAVAFGPALLPAGEAHARAFKEIAAPFVSGRVAPNFLDGDEGAERDRAAYHGENAVRLAAIKAKVDPQNLFRFGRTPGSRA